MGVMGLFLMENWVENIPLDKQGALKIIEEAKEKRNWVFSCY